MLKSADGTPLQIGDPAFVVAYAAAHAERKKPAAVSMISPPQDDCERQLAEWKSQNEARKADIRR
jgi:hypothetical protein